MRTFRSRFVSTLQIGTLAVVTSLGFVGCNGEPTTAAATTSTSDGQEKPHGVDHYFSIKVAGKPIEVQLAVTQREQAKGLMHRDALPEDSGMLFVNKRPARRQFYMKNTLIPLDIAYISPEGTIREIYQMYPGELDTTDSVSDQIQFALEMDQGWFAANRIKPGDKLDLTAVAEALRARGFEPADFAL